MTPKRQGAMGPFARRHGVVAGYCRASTQRLARQLWPAQAAHADQLLMCALWRWSVPVARTCMVVPAVLAARYCVAETTPAAMSTLTGLELKYAPLAAPAAPSAGAPPSVSVASEPAPAFGEKGSWRWNLTEGFAVDVADHQNRFALVGGGFSYFMIDNLSLELEFNALYVHQEGPSAVGANFNLLARWHVLAKEQWSLYVEGGAGMLGTTERVPAATPDSAAGGRFSFTPQLGLGVSYQITLNTRVLVGARLHHISNARTRADNPPRNSLLLYAGLSLPF